jgi:putative spermidine/putrescine transport system ATP-binding protein
MSGLRLEGVGKTFGSVEAVVDVDLELPHGKLVCLLGPSGCGKTTLLRLIAGLEQATSGRILLDGRDLTPVPAHRREFGMVFQSLALFPHLDVGDNVAYGLAIRGIDRPTRRKRAEELLELVRLPGVIDRHVSQLSGGQRQRVAMARALVLDPKLFLLDEPLSALDAKLREAMQLELRELQQRLGITTILVTHDQREAMTMADVVVIMDQGRVQQVAPPLDAYRNPANAFVADFIGSTNLLAATFRRPAEAQVGSATLRLGQAPADLADGAGIKLSVRPEDIHVRPAVGAGEPGENRLPGTVGFIRDLGSSVEIRVRCFDQDLLAVTTPRERPEVRIGEPVDVELPADAIVVLAT